MQNKILRYREIDVLKPHWYELDVDKLKRVKNVGLRKSDFDYHVFYNDVSVLDTPPLLVANNDFILNGKHRGCMALYRNCSIEVFVLDKIDDIAEIKKVLRIHEELDEIMECLDNQNFYYRICLKNNIRSIGDLVVKYKEVLDGL